FDGGMMVVDETGLFFLVRINPHVLSPAIDPANLFGPRKTVISTQANSRVTEGKTESPPVITTSRSLTRDEVAEVQQLLKKMGLDPGPLDGIAGAKTGEAFS